MATEAEEIQKLGEGLNKSIKTLEEKIAQKADASDSIKELDQHLVKLKELGEKYPKLAEQVEEIVVKMNRPDFGVPSTSTGLHGDLEKQLTKAFEGQNLDNQSSSVRFKWMNGQKGLTKAAGTITGANFTDGVNPVAFNPQYDQTVVTSPTRKVHMRSIITQAPMAGDSSRYPQWTDHGEGDFAIQVNQGDKKQQIEENYQMVDLIPRTIAAFYRVAKQEIADIPWLVQSLLSEGTERYLKVEDAKVLYGLGGSNDIKGINEYAALFTGDMPNHYEAVLNPIFELLDADEDPNGVVLRPSTYAQFLKYKSTTGEYNFPMLYVPNQLQPMNIAGVPIFMSTAVKTNEGFVGDWSANNVQIRVREGLSVAFSYEDADNFTENLVTIRLEARIALQLKRAMAFRKINFADVAPAI